MSHEHRINITTHTHTHTPSQTHTHTDTETHAYTHTHTDIQTTFQTWNTTARQLIKYMLMIQVGSDGTDMK